MMNQKTLVQVGSPDPEQKTSPIMEDSDEEFDFLPQELEALPKCYFNNAVFSTGEYICSGSSELLQCQQGIWIRVGTCDVENQ